VSGVFENSAHLISRYVRSCFSRKPHPALNETSANTESTPAITAQDRNPIEARLLTDPQYFNQLVRVEVELTDSICCKCA
jgi:hypothetical protein